MGQEIFSILLVDDEKNGTLETELEKVFDLPNGNTAAFGKK